MAVTPRRLSGNVESLRVFGQCGSRSAMAAWEVGVSSRAALAVSIPGLEILRLDPEPGWPNVPG